MTPDEEAALAELVWELSAPHTLEEIAEHLGMSRRTVSRIEAQAFKKLRGLLAEGPDWQEGLKEPPTLHRSSREEITVGQTPRHRTMP